MNNLNRIVRKHIYCAPMLALHFFVCSSALGVQTETTTLAHEMSPCSLVFQDPPPPNKDTHHTSSSSKGRVVKQGASGESAELQKSISFGVKNTASDTSPSAPQPSDKSSEKLLRHGPLDLATFENERIAPMGSEKQLTFQREMTALMKRGYPKWDAAANPITFVISENPVEESQSPFKSTDKTSEVMNAFLYHEKNGQTMVIGFTAALLKNVRSLDQLAYILYHEGTHRELIKILGEGDNSKGEEYFADTRPLIIMDESGLDPREAMEITERLTQQSKNMEIGFEAYFDVHGLPDIRVEVVKKAVGAIDVQRGGFKDRAPTPLPQIFLELAATRTHESFVQKELKRVNYIQMSVPERTNFLASLLPCLEPDPMNPRFHARLIEFRAEIIKLQLDVNQVAHKEALDHLIKEVLDIQKYSKNERMRARFVTVQAKLYPFLVKLQTGKYGNTPIGSFAILDSKIKSFVQAESLDVAKKSAQEILEITKALPAINIGVYEAKFTSIGSYVEWSNFPMPDINRMERRVARGLKGNEIVSWNQHIAWAKLDSSMMILRALLCIGINDLRLGDIIDPPVADEWLRGAIPALVEEHTANDSSISMLKIGVNSGKALGIAIDSNNGQRMDVGNNRIFLAEIARKKRALLETEESLIELIKKGDKKAFDRLIDRLYEVNRINGDMLSNANKSRLHHLNLFQTHPDIFFMINAPALTLSSRRHAKPKSKLDVEATISHNDRAKELIALFDAVHSKDPQKGMAIIKSFYLSENFSVLGELDDRRLEMPEKKPGASEYKSCSLRIDSPLVKYFLTHQDFFTEEEFLHVLLQTEWLRPVDSTSVGDQPSTTPFQINNLNIIRKKLNYSEPLTASALQNTVQTIIDKKIFGSVDLASAEITVFLRKNPDLFLEIEDSFIAVAKRAFDDGEPFSPDILKNIRREIKSKSTWSDNLDDLSEAWLVYDFFDLFPNDSVLQYEILSKIISLVSRLPDPRERIKYIETFLMRQSIALPALRQKITDIWVDSIYEISGVDNGEDVYYDQIVSSLDRVVAKITIGRRFEIFGQLANRLLTQKRLTKKIWEMVRGELTRERLENTQYTFMFAELIKTIATKGNDKQKVATIDFLLEPRPLTVEKISTYRREVLVPILDAFSLTVKGNNFSLSNKTMDSDTPSNAVLNELIKHFFDNFWIAPFPARVYVISELFAASADKKDEVDRVAAFVCDKLFPARSDPYAEDASQILKEFVKILPSYLKFEFLAATMVAYQKSSDSQISTIGERLAIVLELMGPAETKLGQAIHSNSRVPASIRNGMARLKSMANVPQRWDLFDLMEETLPDKLHGEDIYVGRILGAASFYVVVELKIKGKWRVAALLRPYSLRRAKNGFSNMILLGKALGVYERYQGEFNNILLQMLSHAEKLAAIETSHETARQQYNMQKQLYSGRTVTVNGITYEFDSVDLIDVGPGYRLMNRAKGQHFNALSENTAPQKSAKKNFAKAYVALELLNLMQGKEFDYDRHGDQLRITGTKATVFDPGGMALQAPSEEEIKLLMDTILRCLQNVNENGDLASAFFKEIQRITNETGKTPDYLMRVERGFAALGDFTRYLDVNDFKDIFASVLLDSRVHPHVKETVQLLKQFLQPNIESLIHERIVFGGP